MRALTAEETAALAARRVRARNLVWITAKDRVTAAAQSIGFWDDVGTVSMQVRDALTGLAVARTFIGAGALLGVEDVPLTSDLAIQEVSLTLSQIDATVAQTVRGYDPRLGPIQVYRGLFNPDTHALVAPARCRFVGFVDAIDIVDPRDKGEGRIEIRAVSQLREMTRSNPSMGSDEDQILRSKQIVPPVPVDRFFRYAGAVSEWSVAWGQDKVKVNKGKGK